jgi:3-hydroxyisobutyrate dehydrogenase-like beta-hydroxyacid dehydrogenase
MSPPTTSGTIAFEGLGAMGFGMASHLVKTRYQVTGFDLCEPTRAKFSDAGGKISQSPRDAARGSAFLICMVANSQQVDSVLFDSGKGAVEGISSLN